MPREIREHRLRGRYRLHRIQDDELDEEDGTETVIEYSTGSDSDEEQPRGRYLAKPRGWIRCRNINADDLWKTARDIIIIIVMFIWLTSNLTDHQKEKLATWQHWWDSTAIPAVRNITTESVASLRRFHNRNAPRTDHSGRF